MPTASSFYLLQSFHELVTKRFGCIRLRYREYMTGKRTAEGLHANMLGCVASGHQSQEMRGTPGAGPALVYKVLSMLYFILLCLLFLTADSVFTLAANNLRCQQHYATEALCLLQQSARTAVTGPGHGFVEQHSKWKCNNSMLSAAVLPHDADLMTRVAKQETLLTLRS